MAGQEWQPIETAPNDVEILVYTRGWGVIIARHSEEHGEWLSRMQVPVSLKGEEDVPTHWRDIPEPPAGVEGGSDAQGAGSADGTPISSGRASAP